MTRRAATTLLVTALASVALGCGEGGGGGDLALQQALATTAGRTEGRFSSNPRPLSSAAPHRMTVRCTIALTGAGGERSVAITRTIDRGDGGRFRVRDERSAAEPDLPPTTDGREAVFDGSRFATRRRFGPWIERDVLYGGRERELREAYDLADGLLLAFGDYIRWKEDPRSEERLAGLTVRWAAASLDFRVAPRPLAKAALEALRDHVRNWPAWVAATHRPRKIEGALARTRDGEVVAGQLEVSGDATVEGEASAFTISVSYAVSELPKQAGFALPAKGVLPEARERTWRMIEGALGDDLAAPYRAP